MRILTKIAITAIAVLFLAAALAPAEAACGGNPLIKTAIGPIPQASFIWSQGQWGPVAPSYIAGYSPRGGYPVGPPPMTANTRLTFWALGTGDPIVGPGDDAGAYVFGPAQPAYYPKTPMLYLNYSYVGYGFYIYNAGEIFTGWGANALIDGCVQTNPPGSCTCVLITDNDGTNGYFAIASDDADAAWNFDLVQLGNDGAGNFGPIILRPVPKPTIIHTARKGGSNDLDITVNVASVPSAVYPGRDGASCACGPVGYKVMQAIVARGTPPPPDRDVSWTVMNAVGGGTQPITPMGINATVESLCGAADQDVYIATELQFDSLFVAPMVSGDSTRIECGPNIADPVRPRFRPSDIRPPERQPRRSR